MKTLALIPAIVLAGCATVAVTSSNPRQVIVDGGLVPARNASVAQGVANAECAKYGRYARMVGRPIYGESRDFVFDCVT